MSSGGISIFCNSSILTPTRNGLGIGGVCLNCDGLSTGTFNLLHNRCRCIGTFRVGNGHVRSVRGQTFSDGSPAFVENARQDTKPPRRKRMLRGGRWVKSVFAIGVLLTFFNVKFIQIPGDKPVGSMLVLIVLGGFSV